MISAAEFQKSLRDLVKRRPFRSFVVAFDCGDQLIVERPEMLNYGGGGSALFYHNDGEMTLFHCLGVKSIHEREIAASA